MGLIKAIGGSIGGALHNQWKTLIKCEDMGQDILMMKQSPADGIIPKDSAIIVAPGQLAVIYDSGRIVDATAEEGTYTFDESTSPTFFAGQFGAVFKEMWQRFTYGGAPAKEQAVFFINIREMLNNTFGTRTPVPIQDWSHPIPNQMTGEITPLRVNVRAHGKFTFKIFDPAVFMRTFAGTGVIVKKDELISQMESEVIAVFQSILNELGNKENKVPVLEMPSQTAKIKTIMDEKVFDEPIRGRGVQIVGFAIESVSLDEESEQRITQYENNSNAMMQQGRVLDVMEAAAGNDNGAAMGMMGIGMMNMASGGMSGGVMQNAFSNQAGFPASQAIGQQSAPAGTACPACGVVSTGKFCSSCGDSLEVTGPKTCVNCGAVLPDGVKFCSECGTAAQ